MPATMTALLRQALTLAQSWLSPNTISTTVHRPQTKVPLTSAAVRSSEPGRLANPRPLRVLRFRDASEGGRAADRMVISGNIADVCAELERLAA